MGENTSKGRILIVDDQPGIRESMADVLSIEGYEVYTFENGFSAIEKAKEISFDVAFLDIKMPLINGVDTFRGIKKISPETVVFMITACAEQELIKAAIDEGAYACIDKPFDMNMIIDIVQDSQKKTAILMVDNEKEFVDKIRGDLTNKGYKVISVLDEEQARESFSRKADEVVLVNIKGDVDSKEIFNKIRNITGEENPRIVLINSCRDKGDPGEIITIGTKKLQNKNVTTDELKNTIDGILKGKKVPEKASIMVVGSDTVFANTVSIELGKSGYNVSVVPDCAQAAEHLKISNYELIILNPEVARENCKLHIENLKAIKPGTEVVLLDTDSAGNINTADCNYIQKPFDSTKMLALIKEICEEKRDNEKT